MTSALVGYTGFVGSNLCASHSFDALYNSRNIAEAYGTRPDLLVYSGVRAEMFIANKFPEEDFRIIEGAIDNIRRIDPRNVVLVSTVGVYDSTAAGDENTVIDREVLLPYGRNRLYLEDWVRKHYPEALVVRLPALFGEGIKKNFIFDMIRIVPGLLKEAKYHELLDGTPYAGDYVDRDNGFYKCTVDNGPRFAELKQFFLDKGFTALNFTDSRSLYQFFDLSNLWGLIEQALTAGIRLLTVTSEPVTAAEVYAHVFGEPFVNDINPAHPVQNLRSIHAARFGGCDGYIYPKSVILDGIKKFVLDHKK